MSDILPRRFRLRCEKLAAEQRFSLGLHAFHPLPADDLAKAMRVCIKTPLEMALPEEVKSYLSETDTWFGLLLALDPLTILYNPNQSLARYESTIMHELAHVILEHPFSVLSFCDDRYVRSHNARIEKEAAYLGGCLQIPKRALLWATQHDMDEEVIAEYFGVSLQMVRWRCNATLHKR